LIFLVPTIWFGIPQYRAARGPVVAAEVLALIDDPGALRRSADLRHVPSQPGALAGHPMTGLTPGRCRYYFGHPA
jgi:hypothetical protein